MSTLSQEATSFQALIASRRSIFQFQEKAVAEDIVLRALDAARWAPNHRLTQPWRFMWAGPERNSQLLTFFAQRKQEKMRLRGCSETDIAEQAKAPPPFIPVQILVYCLRQGDSMRQQEDYAATCCAVQNLMLSAWSEGISSGWKSFDHAQGYALFELDPAEVQIVGLIQMGYALRERSAQRQPLESLLVRTR